MTSPFRLIALAVIVCAGSALAGEDFVVEPPGRQAHALVRALQKAIAPSGGGEDGIAYAARKIDCQVNAAARTVAQVRFARCTIDHGYVLKGVKAARIQFALERAGAVGRERKGRRSVSVRDLEATIFAAESDEAARASFKDENAARRSKK